MLLVEETTSRGRHKFDSLDRSAPTRFPGPVRGQLKNIIREYELAVLAHGV